MKDYLARPPVFQAEQWDGSNEKAMEIAEAVKNHMNYPISSKVITYVDHKQTLSTVLEFEWPDGYVKEHAPRRMLANDWMVLIPEGGVEILPDSEFERRYYPKDVTDGSETGNSVELPVAGEE